MGLIGEKLLLTLCNGNMGYYIIVKTTSNGKHKAPSYGCHLEDRFQNFFLPEKSCCMHKDTWIMLNEFFDFSTAELLSKHFSGHIKTIGNLDPEVLPDILQCAISSNDISNAQISVLKQELQQLLVTPKNLATCDS